MGFNSAFKGLTQPGSIIPRKKYKVITFDYSTLNFRLFIGLVGGVWGGGHALLQLVEALLYKPEGHGFYSLWCHFHCYNPSGRTMAPGSTQPLTEMSIRNVSWG